MVAIIQGSNRRGNVTRAVADVVADYITSQGEATTLFDLEHLPGSVLHSDMYAASEAHPYIDKAAESLRNIDRWIIIFPEYNGSFPGALKLFIDALSTKEYETLFGQKVAALIGIASGRAGNLRGIDHLTGVLHHLGTTVMPQALPISLIDQLLDEQQQFADATSVETLQAYLNRFLSYAEEFSSSSV